jgi:hypothetical protein
MISIDDIFFSFQSTEIKGFEKIIDLAKEQSFFPEDLNGYQLLDMSQNHPLWKLKKSLDFPPVEEAMLKLESNRAAEVYKQRIHELLHSSNVKKKQRRKLTNI